MTKHGRPVAVLLLVVVEEFERLKGPDDTREEGKGVTMPREGAA